MILLGAERGRKSAGCQYIEQIPLDAQAIASYLLLREACESFVEVAEQIPESDEPVEIAFHGPDPKLFYRAAMNVADWRRLAELAGEKAR